MESGPGRSHARVQKRELFLSERNQGPDEVNLRIDPGTVLGIVGGTGIGKTTLQHLLSRVLDVKGGEGVVAGENVSDWPIRQLRSLLFLSPRTARCCFRHQTVLETLRFGRQDATLSDVIHVAKSACIHDEIERMPEGYNTLLGPGGIHLSKGQQQRIGLAQALLALRDRKVLILDEFTSALDSRTEQHIIENLRPLLQGKTVIIIAHRLATLRKLADRIVVLERAALSRTEIMPNWFRGIAVTPSSCASRALPEIHDSLIAVFSQFDASSKRPIDRR